MSIDVTGIPSDFSAGLGSAGASSTSAPGSSSSPRRDHVTAASELNAKGDKAYYQGFWETSLGHFQSAYARLETEASRAPSTWSAWGLAAEVALNLGMLLWMRGAFDAAEGPLEMAEVWSRKIPDAYRRWERQLEVHVFKVHRARTEGRIADSWCLVQKLEPLNGDRRSAVYLRLRKDLEIASIQRQAADYDACNMLLLQLQEVLHQASEPGNRWTDDFVPVHRSFIEHFGLVSDVERVLFMGLAGKYRAPGVLNALENVRARLDADATVGVADPNDRFRVYMARDRKALAWGHFLQGHEIAVSIARDAMQEAHSRSDWRTECLARALLGAAQCAHSEVEAGQGELETSFEDAIEKRYWKGQLLVSALALRAARLDGSASAGRKWTERLAAVPREGGAGLVDLCWQGTQATPALPGGPSS